MSKNQIDDYNKMGFLLSSDSFSSEEVECVRSLEEAAAKDLDSPGLVYEEDGSTIRSINGPHLRIAGLERLVHHPKLLLPAQQLLGDDVYVHQFKINYKRALKGAIWEWHQDYIFWKKEDGMIKPDAVTILIVVDEMTEDNGPLHVVPKSHQLGILPIENREVEAPENIDDIDKASWIANTTAKLKYAAQKETAKKLVNQNGLFKLIAKPGTIFLFHPCALHLSPPNYSPVDRVAVLITYNSVSNALPEIANPRPSFLASRDTTPLDVMRNAIDIKN